MLRAGSRTAELLYDGVVTYEGFAGIDGVFHLRLYRPASRRRRVVAIAGALDDDPGISIVGVPESLLAAIDQVLAPRRPSKLHRLTLGFTPRAWRRGEGLARRPRLVEHHPQSLHDESKPSFVSVRLRLTRRGAEHVIARASRRPLGRRGLRRLLGCDVEMWPQEAYTAAAVGGAEGERLREQVAACSTARAAALLDGGLHALRALA